jgi:site-specific recombinase XerD
VNPITPGHLKRNTSRDERPQQALANRPSPITTRIPPHTLSAGRRHSYVTHLIESGMDPLFVQQQAGHDHASTTAIYTCVSSDFRVQVHRLVTGTPE